MSEHASDGTLLDHRDLQLFADYHHFYIQDLEYERDPDAETWTDKAVERLLVVFDRELLIGTARNMTVPVRVEAHRTAPLADAHLWDRVNETAIEIPSGTIVIAGPIDEFSSAARMQLAPGPYHVRISYGGLDTLSDDGLDGDDHYRVQLWPRIR